MFFDGAFADSSGDDVVLVNIGKIFDFRPDKLLDLGFGYVKRREFNSSYGVITGEELRRENPTQDLETALLGRVAGLTKTNGELSLRGQNSLAYSSAPLLIVDGVEVASLSSVNIYDVATVTVHKDGGMYGQKGANGVIVVKLR